MPNHCTNTLTITGPAKEIARFIKRAKSKEESLDANAFIPYPAKFRRMDERANQQRIESNKDREKFQKGEITQVQWDELWETKHSKITDGFSGGGHDWCIKHWGTKWGMNDTQILTQEKKEVVYSFSSAWSPPLPVIQKMGELFPHCTVRLEYREEGCAFEGVFEMQQGQITENESKNIEEPEIVIEMRRGKR